MVMDEASSLYRIMLFPPVQANTHSFYTSPSHDMILRSWYVVLVVVLLTNPGNVATAPPVKPSNEADCGGLARACMGVLNDHAA